MTNTTKDNTWWKHGVVYHVYVRSFFDTNNDGIGDLGGLIQKIDYLYDLGVDAIWLSPVYKSPQIDFGYDVSDFRKIDSIYGSDEDFVLLLNKAHCRGMKIIIDMILNHTSDQHPWFIESRSSIDSPKRKWYIWREGNESKPPNNWRTSFGKKAWEYDEATGEYYYHSFFREQPDLNWRNPEVKEAMFNEIKFWLDMGVDGLRLDVINFIIKDKKFRDNPGLIHHLFASKKLYTRDRKKALKIIKKIRKLVDSYEDRMCVGEIYTLPPGDSELVAKYVGTGSNALNLAFDFSYIFARWNANKYRDIIEKTQNALNDEAWPCIVFSNHDLSRKSEHSIINKIKLRKAKMQALLLLTLKGTPFIYYGEEIGMSNAFIGKKEIKDNLGTFYWPFYRGRDKARTPMQWNDEENAGFSPVSPWIMVNKNYKEVNVRKQNHTKGSLLQLYKTLMVVRKQYKVLQTGTIATKYFHRKILAYERSSDDKTLLILLNFSKYKKKIALSGKYYFLFSTLKANGQIVSEIELSGYEGVILEKEV